MEDPLELVVRAVEGLGPASHEVEVVERKGLGHPDTICDAVAEHFCVRLCRYYLEHFGLILHHNVDKVLLCGGSARAAFGGGDLLEPIEIYMAGRATQEYRGERIPVNEIAVEACREWLETHLRRLDARRDVRIIPRLRPGSTDLARLFARTGAPLANDTSCGAGFAPRTCLEKVVLEIDRNLSDPETGRAHPEIGADIKLMGIRRNSRIDLTIGCAFVARFVRDLGDYIQKKALVRELALEAARRVTDFEVDVAVNTADDVDAGDIYLTATGTSAESGDDGEAGRGNRTSGLITPYRSMTMEAAAGKNPVSHVGKLYNLAASRIAAEIAGLPDVRDAECLLVSQIGHPVTDPQIADVRVALADSSRVAAVQGVARGIVVSELEHLGELREALLEESVALY